ncbi:HsdM family class I SAM-dependent methyltransferase [Clostridium botulinum]|uniref:HsdM family class I SAM-dependent methyltransferase n=1 Tax=Clostridium botulinum TaxID=1491 RepID=UPI0009473343|nr:N-6 DNA methylase [Clostridium botulinum]APQ75767.1 N-6 DNA Methylase family protein [Clostridium botulinum]MBN3354519.1 SAM-dependent DNA methyltransferase [Clostridium botulinum]
MSIINTSESTEITTKLIPKLVFECKVPIENIKTDCSTSITKNKRVDILISNAKNNEKNFEKELLTIIEVKQDDAKILNIYDNSGNVDLAIKKLIDENLVKYGKNSNDIDYSKIKEKDWLNALIQGKWKAEKLNLNFFGVSNIKEVRFYHTNTLLPIIIKKNTSMVDKDGNVINKVVDEELKTFVSYQILNDLRKSITKDNRICDFTTLPYEEKNKKNSMTEQEFIMFLNRIHNEFYGKQLEGSKDYLGDIILTFIFFKYLEERLILLDKIDKYKNDGITLWSDWGKISVSATEKQKGKRIYDTITKELRNLKPNDNAEKDSMGEYKDGYEEEYRAFYDILVPIDKIPENEKGYKFVLEIYEELSGIGDKRKPLYLHGCDFDIYGAIYEKFKNKDQKRELGQYYTKRHISNVLAILTLRPYINDIICEIENKVKDSKKKGNKLKYSDYVEIIKKHYSKLKIIDPSCGTGGILTECYSYLSRQYIKILKRREKQIDDILKESMFTGIDKEPDCVEKAKLNMFFAGDGHTDIDYGSSLEPLNNQAIDFNEECSKNYWNVIISNPPYGQGQEYYFIKKYIKALQYGGRISLIIPNGVLENPSKFYTEFRKFIINNIKIESIISINRFAFAPYAKQKTYMLIGYKRNEQTIKELINEDILLQTDTNNERVEFNNLEDRIWCYIMDYDGFNLSDDRWPTNLTASQDGKPYFIHNDTYELTEKYLIGDDGDGNIIKINQIHIDGSYVGVKRKQQEKIEYILNKAKNIILHKDINEDNFWNILPEYYMRPYNPEYISMEELGNKVIEIENEVKSLGKNKF